MLFDIPIPEWVNWIAQDEDGEWYVYESKPVRGVECWNPYSYAGTVPRFIFVARGLPPDDSAQELYQITWEEEEENTMPTCHNCETNDWVSTDFDGDFYCSNCGDAWYKSP